MRCPICNFNLKNPLKSYLPYYFICFNCTGHFIGKVKKVEYPESYFDEGESFFWLSDLLETPLNLLLELRISYIKNIIKRKNAKILDYGCGSGKLVKKLLSESYSTIGFEPSSGALKITKRLKLPIFKKVKHIKDGYDLIMFWQSLEHTNNPLKALVGIKKYLAKSGKILIAVPNADSIEARLFKKLWFHYTYPMHRVHFNPKSITKMLARAGFKMKEIDFFNPEYTLTGLAQSFLNIFLPENVLYSVISHRRYTLPKNLSVLYSLLSLILLFTLSPIILVIFFIQLIFKKAGAIVVTANYARKVSH